MVLLAHPAPPATAVDRCPLPSSSAACYGGASGRVSPCDSCSSSSSSSGLVQVVEEEEEGGGSEIVFVAVGRSADKVAGLLQWTFRKFGSCEVRLVHVHQPSSTIPTLLGKLPAARANAGVVAGYRKEEWEKTRNLLDSYLRVCYRRKVKASAVTTEAEHVQMGLVDLIAKHRIRKLVMGAAPDGCMKKKRSSKAYYAAKKAPPFCEIWFVYKGKNIWTREAFEGSDLDVVRQEGLRSISMRIDRSKSFSHGEHVRFYSSRVNTSGMGEWIQTDAERADGLALPQPLCSSIVKIDQHYMGGVRSSTSNGSACSTCGEEQINLDSDLKAEEEMRLGQYAELKAELAELEREACMESVKREKLEAGAIDTFAKAKDIEDAHALEVKLRKDTEDALQNTIHERDTNFEERLEVTGQLQKARTNVAVLSSRVQEADSRCNEAAEELVVVQTSIAGLRQEKQNLLRQTAEADCWLERWRSNREAGFAYRNGHTGFLDSVPSLVEFSLQDLQIATCNFSNSFKLGEGGYGCVYKGEMLDKTVAIKQLHVNDIQAPSQFQKEVQVLGKIRHPHLITLIGACPEGWALVYDYLPNGSLQNRLFNRSSPPFSWKDRTRIVSEISCALLHLHSSYPENIVHGDLKPENILLDSELGCKICDFGICRLLTQDTLRCPSFRRCAEPKGAFPYTDPEVSRTGTLTPKSDAYSFGVVILQLLTGKPPQGLVTDVRKAVSQRKLSSILDASAGDWPAFVADKLVNLGLDFCRSNAQDRPSLTPTAVREFQKLHISEEKPVQPYFLCPILQEIMLDPVVAADGHTYERGAFCEWLENGRETSPLTNLPLSHLLLTPNHTLRRAIQDWLCKP